MLVEVPSDARVLEASLAPLETTRHAFSMSRRVAAEVVGSAFLSIAVVGSAGLAGDLATAEPALAILIGALTTAAALFALIEWLGPISGAHFNPLVTFAFAMRQEMSARRAIAYCCAQLGGAVLGALVANKLCGHPAMTLAAVQRSGMAHLLGEAVATFGLISAIWTTSLLRPSATAPVAATYVGAMFWFTASGFANPTLTIARSFTDTAAGITLGDVMPFIIAQSVGAAAAILFSRWIAAKEPLASGRP
ncbi:aquaporin [Sphingomonas sp. UYAg733]